MPNFGTHTLDPLCKFLVYMVCHALGHLLNHVSSSISFLDFENAFLYLHFVNIFLILVLQTIHFFVLFTPYSFRFQKPVFQ